MSAVQSHFPFPTEDWDAKYGGCIDHIKRKIEAQKEFLVITLVNLFFNLIHLFPLVILCKCYNNIPYALWQNSLRSFQTGSAKLERFLLKNQHTQRKLLNFKNWVNRGHRSFQKYSF